MQADNGKNKSAYLGRPSAGRRLDGDCDFSRKRTRYLPHLCGKEDLLTLIDSDPGPELRPVHGLPDYLVLCRRHAVWVPDLMRSETEAG